MEFDARTLQPTFRVIEGIPGESHALDIARRHRMPDAVTERAANLLDAGRSEEGRIINALTQRQREQERMEDELRERAAALARREDELQADRAAFTQREREQHRRVAGELGRFLAEARRDVERAIRSVRATGQTGAGAGERGEQADAAAAVADAAARAVPGAVEKRLQQERDALAALDAADRAAADGAPLAPGSSVRIRRTGAAGRVVRQHRPDRYPDRYVVQTDTIRGEFRAADLMVTDGDPSPATRARVELVNRAEPVLELHVRGMRAEEALQQVERQLDSAVMRGMTVFSVVHGDGHGVLRHAIREYLSDSSAVSDYQDAPADEGGHGKTIVRLCR
jgi:DNA mismatch repair protein MutS2